MRALAFLPTVIVFALLSSCTRSADPACSVSYYRTHDAERREQLRICRNDPARTRQKPSCVNALRAEQIEGVGSLNELPPLKFPAAAVSAEQRQQE
jgi:hypothetical protein